MERWCGRFALVTGASSGIGATVAKELVQRGMIVFGCGRNIKNIQALSVRLACASGRLHPMKCDLTSESEILAMFKKIQVITDKIDLCINNAGVGHISPLMTGDSEKWKDMFEVNVMGLCVCTREAVKFMKTVPEGQIINMGSIGAHILPDSSDQAGFNFYRSTKSMVRVVTEGLRQEIRAITTHIRVASISAGIVETDFFNKNLGPEKAKELYAVMGSLQTEDIVETMIYILSTPPRVDVSDIIVQAMKNPPSPSEDLPELVD